MRAFCLGLGLFTIKQSDSCFFLLFFWFMFGGRQSETELAKFTLITSTENLAFANKIQRTGMKPKIEDCFDRVSEVCCVCVCVCVCVRG